ncbi:endosialidase [Clostridium sp. Marseille-P3244]|uniref:endosialidase n=1 Tax=Clostridium sp. Marseille-P3244 TaxID=1871020 RepID=UPI0009310E61|nr:endosialidase [Clostridium sp. Marseille-P3244]
MAAIKELLRAENDGTLSFGDYTLADKTKKDNYEFEGDIYKVKTFAEITKLERNGMFVYESVPGSAVEGFRESDTEISFTVSARGDVQFTLELEPESEYEVFIDGDSAGRMGTNLSGKLSVSVELGAEQSAKVRIVKC